ncbi:hypothetical protein SteCoe_19970 [Stentor coeruleus]|uniref:Uncharacterized protein n=1 Tax=Stentor coeruleus TaxID=5963 RepID=A0A1R2BT10_9CILI|nr:hypothetical protein SteCoe_19970 [Stentor coeruleus]
MSIHHDTNNLVDLLEKARQKLKKRQKSEINSHKKFSLENSENVSKNLIPEKLELSWTSHTSLNEQISEYLIDQISEIKDLFKSQEQIIEKFRDEKISYIRDQENRGKVKKTEKVEYESFEKHQIYGRYLGNHERNCSMFASAIHGCEKSELHKEAFFKPEPILSFAKNRKRFRFYERIMVSSHLSILNL